MLSRPILGAFCFPVITDKINLNSRINIYKPVKEEDYFILLGQSQSDKILASMNQALFNNDDYIDPQKNLYIALSDRHLRLSYYIKNR